MQIFEVKFRKGLVFLITTWAFSLLADNGRLVAGVAPKALLAPARD